MVDSKRQLAAALRERGVLDVDVPLVAAWSGLLAELSGHDIAAADRPAAVLGITEQAGYLLSRFGVLSFNLSDITGTPSGGRGQLAFTIASDEEAEIRVVLLVDMPFAMATQLDDMSRFAVGRGGRAYLPVPESKWRPPPKRRSNGEPV